MYWPSDHHGAALEAVASQADLDRIDALAALAAAEAADWYDLLSRSGECSDASA